MKDTMKIRRRNIKEACDILDSLKISGLENWMKLLQVVRLITEEEREEEENGSVDRGLDEANRDGLELRERSRRKISELADIAEARIRT